MMQPGSTVREVVTALLLVALAACQAVPPADELPPAGAPGTGEATVEPTATNAPPAIVPTVAPPEASPTPGETPEETATALASPSAAQTSTPLASPTAPATQAPAMVTAVAENVEPRVEVVATGLVAPWALAWAPDGRLFVAERPGRLRVIVDGVLQPEPLAEIPVAATGEAGLMGLALDPRFDENGYLYVMYTYQDGGGLANRISRLALRDGQLGDEEVLVDGIRGARNHDGGRIAFGPDGMLYATTGDAGRGALAQDLNSLNGKILRMNADGSVPSDNPFPGSLVYSYGHRNPQGLAWHPETGQLYATEHGPSGERGLCCRDEVNVIVPGANYGWPEVVAGEGAEGVTPPVATSGSSATWAPAGAAFYTGSALPGWQGSLLFGTLRGQHLHRLVLERETVVGDELLFANVYGRLREVAMGPDGHLYVTTSNRDGRGSPASDDDRVLRIVAE